MSNGNILEFRKATVVVPEPYEFGLEAAELRLEPGELGLVALERGQGPTPLAETAQGLIAPVSGEVLFSGKDWSGLAPAEAAAGAPLVFTMVGYPSDVEATYYGESGVLDAAGGDAVLVDLTTSDPALARRIAADAAKRGLHALDCPVSGGDVGARNATLSIMCGGESQAFERARPLLELMGKNVVLQGPAGSGQATKMCNQIAIASGMLGVCEAMAYAEKSGLDPESVLTSIEHGAAGSWSLSNLAPRMIRGDFAPGFYVEHFIKDMRIAEESAKNAGLEAPGLALALRMYERLAEQGSARQGTQALYRLYRELS